MPEAPVNAVAQPVPATDNGQKPGLATVTWDRNIWQIKSDIGAADSVALEDTPGDQVAEVSHHRDPAAIATQRVVHATMQTDVRYVVIGERHVPGPGVADARTRELRETRSHGLVQELRPGFRIDVGETRPAAKDDAPAIRRSPVVVQDSDRSYLPSP